jgi:hypothetical protein
MSTLRIALVAPLLFLALLVGCTNKAARTSLDTTWADPQARGAKFTKVLVISIASDEFAQQYFQQDMAAALKKRGVNAVASGRYFTHRSPSEEARFRRAVEESGADAVLLGRVVGSEEVAVRSGGMLTTPGGRPVAPATGLYGAYGHAFAPLQYVPPSEGTRKTVMVETMLFEMKDRQAIWTARTHTENAEQGDLKPAISQFVSVLVGAMARDGLF